MQYTVQITDDQVTLTMSRADYRELILAQQGDSAPEVAEIFDLLVDSFTREDKTFLTRIFLHTDGSLRGTCECEDHTYRARYCKHLQVNLRELPDRVFRAPQPNLLLARAA